MRPQEVVWWPATALASLLLAGACGCSPAEPSASPLGDLHWLSCEFYSGLSDDGAEPVQWQLLVNKDGLSRLSEFHAGVWRDRVAYCDDSTFAHFADALRAAEFTRLEPTYAPLDHRGFYDAAWDITASTSTGEWSVSAMSKRSPDGLVAVQEALSAFKQTANWRDQ